MWRRSVPSFRQRSTESSNDADGHSALADGLARLPAGTGADGGHRRLRGGAGVRAAGSGTARGGGQPAHGPRLRPRHAAAGQDRPHRCGDPGRVRRRTGAQARLRAVHPSPERTRAAGPGCAGDASPPVGLHAAVRAPAAAAGAAGGTTEHRGPARGDRASTRRRRSRDGAPRRAAPRPDGQAAAERGRHRPGRRRHPDRASCPSSGG